MHFYFTQVLPKDTVLSFTVAITIFFHETLMNQYFSSFHWKIAISFPPQVIKYLSSRQNSTPTTKELWPKYILWASGLLLTAGYLYMRTIPKSSPATKNCPSLLKVTSFKSVPSHSAWVTVTKKQEKKPEKRKKAAG